jgi:hypothetical protein
MGVVYRANHTRFVRRSNTVTQLQVEYGRYLRQERALPSTTVHRYLERAAVWRGSSTGWFRCRTRGRSAFWASEFAAGAGFSSYCRRERDFPGLDFLEGQNAGRKVLPEVVQTIRG